MERSSNILIKINSLPQSGNIILIYLEDSIKRKDIDLLDLFSLIVILLIFDLQHLNNTLNINLEKIEFLDLF